MQSRCKGLKWGFQWFWLVACMCIGEVGSPPRCLRRWSCTSLFAAPILGVLHCQWLLLFQYYLQIEATSWILQHQMMKICGSGFSHTCSQPSSNLRCNQGVKGSNGVLQWFWLVDCPVGEVGSPPRLCLGASGGDPILLIVRVGSVVQISNLDLFFFFSSVSVVPAQSVFQVIPSKKKTRFQLCRSFVHCGDGRRD